MSTSHRVDAGTVSVGIDNPFVTGAVIDTDGSVLVV